MFLVFFVLGIRLHQLIVARQGVEQRILALLGSPLADLEVP
jgi:hypothetical protein